MATLWKLQVRRIHPVQFGEPYYSWGETSVYIELAGQYYGAGCDYRFKIVDGLTEIAGAARLEEAKQIAEAHYAITG